MHVNIYVYHKVDISLQLLMLYGCSHRFEITLKMFPEQPHSKLNHRVRVGCNAKIYTALWSIKEVFSHFMQYFNKVYDLDPSNKRNRLPTYSGFSCKDQTIVRPSYLYKGIILSSY